MSYMHYHEFSAVARDIDPANDVLDYIATRYELNMEQRYWLAFLFSTCYCAPTVFYIYNEFPDFENVDPMRLLRWWKANKGKLVFQTDRARIRSNDQFCETFASYREFIGRGTQEARFNEFRTSDLKINYHNGYKELEKIRNVGRFTIFIYLDVLNRITTFKTEPGALVLAEAESCRNGLCYAIGRPDLLTLHKNRSYKDRELKFLAGELSALRSRVEELTTIAPEFKNMYAIETTLCAYKKYCLGKRWVGYYKERQLKEIKHMEFNVSDGVDWSILYDFREEVYKSQAKERTLNVSKFI